MIIVVKKVIKVLLVEDNPGDVLIIEKMFEEIINIDFKLVKAYRLSEGLEKLNKEWFDVIILDLGLPDSQGIETFNHMNQKAPEIPIILLTGFDEEEFGIKAVYKGAQDYLVKGQVDSRLLSRSIYYAIERKRIEDRLKKSEEKYRIIVEKTQSGLFLINSNNRLNYVNQKMAEMLGYKTEEMINRIIFDFMDKEGIKTFSERLKNLNEGTNNVYELKFISSNGSAVWALISTNSIFNSNGKYLGAVSVMTDISARKGVEKTMMEAMIEKDHNFRLIMANMMEAIKPLITKEYNESYDDKLT